eukprot:gene1389-1602_t
MGLLACLGRLEMEKEVTGKATLQETWATDVASLGTRLLAKESRKQNCLMSLEKNIKLVGSTKILVDHLANGLDIRLGQSVTSVDYTASDKIEIKTLSGQEFTARTVLVTVPIPILQRGDIQFTPSLPDDKQEAIKLSKMGHAAKCIVKFSKRPWPEHMQLLVCTTSLIPQIWFDGPPDAPDRPHVAIGFISGDTNMQSIKSMTDQEIANRLLDQLDSALLTYGYRDKSATSVYVSSYFYNWSNNPNTLGAYTYPPPLPSNYPKDYVPSNIIANDDDDDGPLDEFGRPLRPGRESSDSDSDNDYKGRGYRRGGRRDYDRYSPDRNRKRDHSPSGGSGNEKRRDRSPSPYRDRRRRDDWNDNRNGDYNGRNRNGRDEAPHMGRSMSPSKQSTGSSISSAPRRIKRGDIFEGGIFKTYKQFLDYQDDSITPTDAEKRYEEYKVEFAKRQARVFFKDHQTEEWFREKYDPSFLVKKRSEKIVFAKSRIPSFEAMLKDETFNFSLTSKVAIKDGDGMDLHEDEHDHDDDHHHHHSDAEDKEKDDSHMTSPSSSHSNNNNSSNNNSKLNNSTLFIKAISPSCTKEDLLEVLNRVGTPEDPNVVTKLTLSEPMKYKSFYRLGWVTFKNSDYSFKALKELNGTKMRDFDMFLTINKQLPSETQKKFRVTPKIASTEQRITLDLAQALNVTKQLDEDRQVTENPLLSDYNFESLSEIDRLDRTIHYLRHTHLFCYYCSEEYSDIDEIERKCGSTHLRRALSEESASSTTTTSKADDLDESTEASANEPDAMDTDSTLPRSSDADNIWVTNLDNNIKAKINKINNQEQYTCAQTIEKSAEEFIQINTFKIEDEKYRCSLCAKLFKGSEYVKKHINLKHPEELKKDSEEKGTEEQFFLNYFSDPRRMTTPPPSQQMYGYQNPRMMAPRPRWNPAIGQWEQPMVGVPQMMPGMMASAQSMSAMGFQVSPGMFSPGVRGRGIPLPLPLPMRGRFPVPGVVQPGQGVVGSSPTQLRYRPYPSPQQPRTLPHPPADPRGIREYVDLDAPSDSMPDIDYRAALKEYQNKRGGQ